jgi:hypothetical protein
MNERILVSRETWSREVVVDSSRGSKKIVTARKNLNFL